MPSKIQFNLLGGFSMRLNEENVEALSPVKHNLLLAYLLTFSNRKHHREEICTLFWLDSGNSRQNLRQSLFKIRRQLSAVSEEAETALFADDFVLSIDPDRIATDVLAFEKACQEGLKEQGSHHAIQKLQGAYSLYQGEFLAGFQADWVLEERRRLEALFENLCLALSTKLEEISSYASALEVTKRSLQVNPFQEQAQTRAIRLYAKMGQPQSAKKHYEGFVEQWNHEFKIPPPLRPREVERLLKTHYQEPLTDSTSVEQEAFEKEIQEAKEALWEELLEAHKDEKATNTEPVEPVTSPPLRQRHLAYGVFGIVCFVLVVAQFLPKVLPHQTPVTLWGPASYTAQPTDKDGQPMTVKTDAQGNIYAAGFVKTTNQDVDILVVKFSPEGKELMQWRYDNPELHDMDRLVDMAVDAKGYVYVTGESMSKAGARPENKQKKIPEGDWSDIVTIKYAPDKQEPVWVKRYNPCGDKDVPAAIGVDGQGNVYVAGTTKSPNAPFERDFDDIVLLKYSPTGDVLLEKIYKGHDGKPDFATAMVVDEAGNAYVTGRSYGHDSEADYITIKYDAAGSLIWDKRLDGSAHAEDIPKAIAVAPSGNVYVTGYSMSNDAYKEYMTVKYDANGYEKWRKPYNGAGTTGREDVANSIALDAEENVYVTGKSDGNATFLDIATVKYDKEGNQKWDARVNGPASKEDIGRMVVVGRNGNIYVTGEQYNGHGDKGGNEADAITLCYDPKDGQEIWRHIYDGSVRHSEGGYSMAIDKDDNLVVLLDIHPTTYHHMGVIKYSP